MDNFFCPLMIELWDVGADCEAQSGATGKFLPEEPVLMDVQTENDLDTKPAILTIPTFLRAADHAADHEAFRHQHPAFHVGYRTRIPASTG